MDLPEDAQDDALTALIKHTTHRTPNKPSTLSGTLTPYVSITDVKGIH